MAVDITHFSAYLDGLGFAAAWGVVQLASGVSGFYNMGYGFLVFHGLGFLLNNRFAVGWFGGQRGRLVAVEAQTAQMQRGTVAGVYPHRL